MFHTGETPTGQQVKRHADAICVLVAAEQVTDRGPRQAVGAGVPQCLQRVVRHRIAKVVAEDVSSARFGILPNGESGLKVGNVNVGLRRSSSA